MTNTWLARDVMQRDVLSAQDDWSLHELSDFLLDHEISGAPVRDHAGKLVGVVSLTDLAVATSEGEGEQIAELGPDYFADAWESGVAEEELVGLRLSGSARRVGDIMNPALYTVAEETPVHEVAEVMLEAHIHRVLVTHGAEGEELVGIITTSDLLRLVARSSMPVGAATHPPLAV